MRRAMVIAFLAIATAGCAGSRILTIEATRPARIDGVCPATPCSKVISRETCAFFNSSSGFVGLTAHSEDGIRLDSPRLETCAIAADTTLRFIFPAADNPDACGVDILVAGELASHMDCATARRFGAQHR